MSTEDKAKAEVDKTIRRAEKGLLTYATDYGQNPLPPTILATLITSLHARPFQPLPLVFAPVLLFSTYLNLSTFVVDSAGLTAAWSGLYLLLASRRKGKGNGLKMRMGNTFGARGLTRGAAMGVAGLNVLGCGITYAIGERKKREEKVL